MKFKLRNTSREGHGERGRGVGVGGYRRAELATHLPDCKLLDILLDFPDSSRGKESACNAGDMGSIPGSGRSPGGGNGHLPSILA